jgi:galacturan 1,4-alpha-galacturonidase
VVVKHIPYLTVALIVITNILLVIMLKPLILGLLQATGTFATWTAYQEYVQTHNTSVKAHESNRPSLVYSPQRPYKKMHASPKRTKKCIVKSHNDFKTDDSEYILKAVEKCNNGGHVVFPEGTTYVVGTALDLTGLRRIDIGMSLDASSLMLGASRM